MSKPLPVKIDGQTVYFEVETASGFEEVGVPDDMLDKAEDAFDRTKDIVVSIAKGMVGAIRTLDEKLTPDEFSMEFAVKLSGEGNVIVTKVGAEANFKISLKYVHKKA